jgi:hypothetical protein
MFNDLEFVRNPNDWPMYPYLPLKRRGHLNNTGFICADGASRTIYLANIFAVMEGEVEIANTEKIIYSSLEELLKDGWMVD